MSMRQNVGRRDDYPVAYILISRTFAVIQKCKNLKISTSGPDRLPT